jgi:hypothetical protein
MRKVAIWAGVFLIVAASITMVAHYGLQRSEAFQTAHAYVLAQPQVRELGDPVEAHLRFLEASLKWSSSTGSADFAIDVEGQRGKAIAYVQLKKSLGQWSVVDWRLTPSES